MFSWLKEQVCRFTLKLFYPLSPYFLAKIVPIKKPPLLKVTWYSFPFITPSLLKYVFLFVLFLLISERRRDRERERETSMRNISHLPPALLLLVIEPEPQHVLSLGIEPVTFWCMGLCSTNCATQVRPFYLFC